MKIKYLLILLFLLTKFTAAQWAAGGSINMKSDVPKHGFGLRVERKLPFQFPDFGVSVRFNFDYYQLSYKENTFENKSYFGIDNSVLLMISYFPKYYQPYAGLGIGTGHLLIERVNTSGRYKFTNEIEKFVFALAANAGVKITALGKFIPFAEFQAVNYIGSYRFQGFDPGIDKFQIRGAFGVLIAL